MTGLRIAPQAQTHASGVPAAAPTVLVLRVLVGAAAPVFGAFFAATADLAPTGQPYADVFWSVAFGGFIGMVASRVQPALLIGCSLLGLLAASNAAMIAGFGLAVIGLFQAHQLGFFGRLRRDVGSHLLAAAAGACAVVLLLGLQDVAAPRTSAAITAAIVVVFAIAAFAHLAPGTRRRVQFLALAAVVFLAVLGVFELRYVRSLETEVRQSEVLARAAVSALRSGNYETGLERLAEAELAVTSATAEMSSLEGRILQATPAAGVNATVMSETLHTTDRLLESILAMGDPNVRLASLFQGGAVDSTMLEALQHDASEITEQINALDRSTASDSVWLAPQLTRSLASLDTDLAEAVAYSDRIDTAVSGLPGILGMDGPRRYLVLFGNPAEARELGGIAGGTGVVELDQGSLHVQPVARRAPNRAPATIAALTEAQPVRFLEHRPWQWEPNYTAMADFPSLSRALADVYPAMGGQTVDGVIYLDPFALKAIVAMTGPIRVDSLGRDVSADEIPELLMVDQYALFEPGVDREELFVDLFASVADAVRSRDLQLDEAALRGLMDVVDQDRLLLAPLAANELASADALGLTGAIGELSTNDYLAVSHLNSGGNKLDTYLHRTVSYAVELDPTDNSLDAVVDIQLRNAAPGNLPGYAAGAVEGQPGTARVTVVVHTPHELVGWRGLTEEPELVRSFREFGRWRHEASVHIARGDERTVQLILSGAHDGDDYSLDIGHQPLVTNDRFAVVVDGAPGQAEMRAELVLTEDLTVEFG